MNDTTNGLVQYGGQLLSDVRMTSLVVYLYHKIP